MDGHREKIKKKMKTFKESIIDIPRKKYATAVFDAEMPHGLLRAGQSHTGRAVCAVVAECCLFLWKSP